MGQQQLLLLVLGIVIVGLAVVVGISAFSENRIKASADALVADGLRIASDVQAWALKPKQLGEGGGKSDALSSLLESGGLQLLGYPSGGEEGIPVSIYSNPNGTFFLDSACMSMLGPGADPVIPSGKEPILYVNGMNIQIDFEGGPGANPEVIICIGIAGTNAGDIGTNVQYTSSNPYDL